jgi:hypothetical protein
MDWGSDSMESTDANAASRCALLCDVKFAKNLRVPRNSLVPYDPLP